MNSQETGARAVNLPLTHAQFEELLEGAAERGAKKALAAVGLDDEHAADDIRGLRGLLKAYRTVQMGALKQLGQTIILLMAGAFVAWAGVKFKIIGS